MTPDHVRPTRAEIDIEALVRNVVALKQTIGQSGILVVVKADAYGHGAVPVARALEARAPIMGLAVSLVEEGLELRRAGIRGLILVMGGAWAGAHAQVLAQGLTPVVSSAVDLEPFALAARATSVRPRVHLKLDTGMARLGIGPSDLSACIEAVRRFPELEIAGVCTHLACADGPDEAPTIGQLRRFDECLATLSAAGIRPTLIHAANSAAAQRFPQARYDAVRPGLRVYAGAMRLVTEVTALRWIEAGQAVSYGGLWRAARRSRIATLPIGYADGYPRRLTGSGEVLVRGMRCPVVGAICMDLTLVDVTTLAGQVERGEEAVLLGGPITVAELAQRAGLIEYEITCGISKRVPRVVRASP